MITVLDGIAIIVGVSIALGCLELYRRWLEEHGL